MGTPLYAGNLRYPPVYVYDLLIVGGGPIGLACGLAAQHAGLRYCIVEKGCLVNSLYHYPLGMTFFSTSDRLEIGGIPFPSIAPKPTRAEALEYYRRVADSQQLQLRLFEQVLSVDDAAPSDGARFHVRTDRAQYWAQHVVLATGFYDIPNPLNVPGEDLPHVTHYYREPHAYYRQHVLVVGANNSAADAALETWRKGAQVTMAVREPALGRIKYWTKPDLENRIAEGSIQAFFQTTVAAIRPGEADLLTPDGLRTVPADAVLAMTGYQPNFALLQALGVQLTADEKRYPSHNPDTMETNRAGLYLAGVVCGGMDTHVWFIENSRVHAQKIVADVLRKQARIPA